MGSLALMHAGGNVAIPDNLFVILGTDLLFWMSNIADDESVNRTLSTDTVSGWNNPDGTAGNWTLSDNGDTFVSAYLNGIHTKPPTRFTPQGTSTLSSVQCATAATLTSSGGMMGGVFRLTSHTAIDAGITPDTTNAGTILVEVGTAQNVFNVCGLTINDFNGSSVWGATCATLGSGQCWIGTDVVVVPGEYVAYFWVGGDSGEMHLHIYDGSRWETFTTAAAPHVDPVFQATEKLANSGTTALWWDDLGSGSPNKLLDKCSVGNRTDDLVTPSTVGTTANQVNGIIYEAFASETVPTGAQIESVKAWLKAKLDEANETITPDALLSSGVSGADLKYWYLPGGMAGSPSLTTWDVDASASKTSQLTPVTTSPTNNATHATFAGGAGEHMQDDILTVAADGSGFLWGVTKPSTIADSDWVIAYGENSAANQNRICIQNDGTNWELYMVDSVPEVMGFTTTHAANTSNWDYILAYSDGTDTYVYVNETRYSVADGNLTLTGTGVTDGDWVADLGSLTNYGVGVGGRPRKSGAGFNYAGDIQQVGYALAGANILIEHVEDLGHYLEGIRTGLA